MRAEFSREAEPDAIVGAATWTGSGVEIVATDPKVRRALGRVYRQTSVLVDDPSVRSSGRAGPGLLAPGTVRWFVACTGARSRAEKLAFRLWSLAWSRPWLYRLSTRTARRIPLNTRGLTPFMHRGGLPRDGR